MEEVFGFWIFWVGAVAIDGGQFEIIAPFGLGDEIGLGDFEGSGADFVQGERRVRLYFLGTDQVRVDAPPFAVSLRCECLTLFLLPLFFFLFPSDQRSIEFLFAHLLIITNICHLILPYFINTLLLIFSYNKFTQSKSKPLR